MKPDIQGPVVPEKMHRPRRSQRWIAPGFTGLAIGLVMGFAAGFGLASAPTDSGSLNEKSITAAVENCGMDSAGYTILDEGAAIELDTKGEDFFDTGTEDYTAYTCMLSELGVPESTQQKIGRTRALDGTQSDSWGGLKASWSYHPDNGANVLIENEGAK